MHVRTAAIVPDLLCSCIFELKINVIYDLFLYTLLDLNLTHKKNFPSKQSMISKNNHIDNEAPTIAVMRVCEAFRHDIPGMPQSTCHLG